MRRTATIPSAPRLHAGGIHPAAAPPRPIAVAVQTEAEARLELLEALLAIDDVEQCAHRAVAWLAAHSGVERVLCALHEGEAGKLIGVSGYRIASSRVRAFALHPDDAGDALLQAISAADPAVLPAGLDDAIAVLFLGARVHAFPLPTGEGIPSERVGLLLASFASPSAAADLRWIADALGRRLRQLRSFKLIADAESRLVHERTLVYTLVNAIPDPILLTDTEGRLILANARAESLLASAEGESEGRSRAVALNNMLFSAALAQRVISGTAASRRELPLVDPIDGSDRLYELFSAPVDKPQGTVVSVLRNVTDLQTASLEIEENYRRLRTAESEIRTERDRLTLIIDSVANPILVTSPAGAIVLMNAPAERLFTLKKSASGKEIQRVRANDAHFSSHVSNLFVSSSGQRWQGDVALVDPETGRSIPVEAISGTVLADGGEVTAIVTILHDRTEAIEKARLYKQVEHARDELEAKVSEATAELHRQKELLQRQNIELEQASALKSQFLANMSHEFRTPLNAILGYTSMLLQGVSGPMSPQQTRSLSRVDSNAHHLLTIINDILDISRIEAGKMPMRVTSFKLQDLFAELMAELEPLVARSKLSIGTRVEPGNMPQVRTDRAKVKQLLVNLLTNAIKFTPAGSVTMVGRHDRRSKVVCVEVIDTGIGIAKEDQERVFEDFRQADNSPTREYGGAGLGLAICRRLASVLGGSISLASQVGEGSTFTLILPLKLGRRR